MQQHIPAALDVSPGRARRLLLVALPLHRVASETGRNFTYLHCSSFILVSTSDLIR